MPAGRSWTSSPLQREARHSRTSSATPSLRPPPRRPTRPSTSSPLPTRSPRPAKPRVPASRGRDRGSRSGRWSSRTARLRCTAHSSRRSSPRPGSPSTSTTAPHSQSGRSGAGSSRSLDLVDSPLRRRDVIAFLSDGRMPRETRERFGGAPPARWDSISRRAGVVEGIEQWRSRLTSLRDREAASAAEEGAPEWLQRRVEDCDALLAFVEAFAADLGSRPERASWSESLVFLRRLLETYVDGASDVLGYLDQLAELDALVPEVDFARFLDVVRAEVQALKAADLDEGQQGAFGRRGVNVLDVNQLRNLRFRAVAVLGLTERAFPPPPRQDPLLLDDERVRLNEAGGFDLPLRARGADPEPLQFALAVAAARERLLLSTRRAEEPGGRMQLPSSFFRAAAGALEGRARACGGGALARPRSLPARRPCRRRHAGARADRRRARPHRSRARSHARTCAPRAAGATGRTRRRRAPGPLGDASPHAVRRHAHRRRRPRRDRRAARRARLLGDLPRDLRELPLQVPAERDPAPRPARGARADRAHRRTYARRRSRTASSSASSLRSTHRSPPPARSRTARRSSPSSTRSSTPSRRAV